MRARGYVIGLSLVALCGALGAAWLLLKPGGTSEALRPARRVSAAPAGSAPAQLVRELPPPAPDVYDRGRDEPDRPDASAASRRADGSRQQLAPREVTLFEHANHDDAFPGRTWKIGFGLTSSGAVFADDDASAVQVPTGLQVTLYEHADGAGLRTVLGPGMHNLAPYGFNDRVSSARVSRFGEDTGSPLGGVTVELYEHRSAEVAGRGTTWKLGLATGHTERLFTARDKHFAARSASAAWVPEGYELTLFREPDGHGAAVVLGPGFHELALIGFNDRALSARVRRR